MAGDHTLLENDQFHFIRPGFSFWRHRRCTKNQHKHRPSNVDHVDQQGRVVWDCSCYLVLPGSN